jgi:hypothetical protein
VVRKYSTTQIINTQKENLYIAGFYTHFLVSFFSKIRCAHFWLAAKATSYLKLR